MGAGRGRGRVLHGGLGWAGLVVIVVVAAGCSPPIAPLYRDYERGGERRGADRSDTSRVDIYARIDAALRAADWTPAEEHVVANVVATEMRKFQHWGLYRVVAYLEVAPVGEAYVRVYLHPYRQYIWRTRTKIPYLPATLKHRIVPELNAAFEAQGLHVFGAARDSTVAERVP